MARNKKVDESRELFENGAKVIEESPMEEFVEEAYLPFAWSVCLDRALVNVCDGLKPIQRRILYTAYMKKLTDKSAKIKSVIFEGDVLRYSPHGGAYSSIVNMAESEEGSQPRPIRVPLVKGKGNWGGISSDTCAASRYTEMNLWPAALELIKEIDENAVEMIPNYDGTLKEPKYLPARWPVAFINGVPDAMAVGFACNMPSHNPDEVMNACIALAKDRNLELKEIMKYVKGPDFNCGCDILPYTEKDGKKINGIKSYLETGSGTFTMRAKYDLKEEGGKYTIEFYALPYRITPEKVIESIKKKYDEGKLKELNSWKDLSDLKHPVLLELQTKKNINIDKLISDLYKSTPLQCTFAANNTIIKDMVPQKLDIKTILEGFIDFRISCTKNKLNHRLANRKEKLHIQEAYKAVLLDIDKCLKIIRNADDDDVAKSKLMKTFKIDDVQAEHILEIKLRALTKKDSHEVNALIDKLTKEINEIEGILSDENKLNEFIVSELEDTKKVISSPRKCQIIRKTKEEEIKEQDVYILNRNGKVKRCAEKTEGATLAKDGRFIVVTSDSGAAIRSVYEIPDNKFVAYSRLQLKSKGVIAAGSDGYLVLVGEQGTMKIVDLSALALPNKQNIDKILAQPVKDAFIIEELTGTIEVTTDGKKKSFNITDLPVFGIGANGNKVYRKRVDSVVYKK